MCGFRAGLILGATGTLKGSASHRLRIFNWRTLQPLCVLVRHADAIRCLATTVVEGVGWLLAAGSSDTQVSMWSVYSAV